MSDQWPGTPAPGGGASEWPGTPAAREPVAAAEGGSTSVRGGGGGSAPLAERYQTWPERAIRDIATLPKRAIDAAGSAPPGSPELRERLVGPALETALLATPLSAGMRGAAPATGVAAPTAAEIGTASRSAYQYANELGLQFKPDVVRQLADDLTAELSAAGYRDYLAQKTFRALDELRTIKAPTYQDIDGVRKLLGRAGADPAEKDAVRRAIDGIDNFIGNLSQEQVIAGTPELAATLSRQARGNWAAKKQIETVEDVLAKAERQAGSAHSGANIDNAIRQQIKTIRNSPKKSRGFQPEELAQMDAIIHGTAGGNLLRTGGNFLGGGGGLGASLTAGGGALVSSSVGLGPLGAALPLVGYGLKQAGGASTRRQVEQLLEMIRRRSPAAENRGATATPTMRHLAPETMAAPARAAAPGLGRGPLAPNEL